MKTSNYTYLTNGCCEDTGLAAVGITPAEALFLEETDIEALGGYAQFGYSYAIGNQKFFGPEVVFMSCAPGEEPAPSARAAALHLAKTALPTLKKAAARFGGTASLTEDDEQGDRHIIRCFCPMSEVAAQFTPAAWKAYWEALLGATVAAPH